MLEAIWPKQGQLSVVTYIKRARPKKTDCFSPKIRVQSLKTKLLEVEGYDLTGKSLVPQKAGLKACRVKSAGSFPVPRTPGTKGVKGFSHLYTALGPNSFAQT